MNFLLSKILMHMPYFGVPSWQQLASVWRVLLQIRFLASCGIAWLLELLVLAWVEHFGCRQVSCVVYLFLLLTCSLSPYPVLPLQLSFIMGRRPQVDITLVMLSTQPSVVGCVLTTTCCGWYQKAMWCVISLTVYLISCSIANWVWYNVRLLNWANLSECYLKKK